MDLDALLTPSDSTTIYISLTEHQREALQGVQPGEPVLLAPGEKEDQGFAARTRTLKGSMLEVSALYILGLSPIGEITNATPMFGQRRLSQGYAPSGQVYRGKEAIQAYTQLDYKGINTRTP